MEPADPRLVAARADVALLADWLARQGREVPAAYRLLLSDDPRTVARGRERVAAARAWVLDGTLDERTCFELARDDLAARAAPATAEGLRAAEHPGEELFKLRRRRAEERAHALQLRAGTTLGAALVTVAAAFAGAWSLAALAGGLTLAAALAAEGTRRARGRERRALRERRWSALD